MRDDLEGFFLIIMVGLMDTFLQNPVGTRWPNNPVLRYFPSFGPTQFAAGGAFENSAAAGYLALGLAWAVGFALAGLALFTLRTRRHRFAR